MISSPGSAHFFRLLILLAFAALATCSGVSDTPEAPLPVASMSIFGISGDAHTGLDLTKWMPQMSAIGIHAMRCATPSDPDQMAYLDTMGIKYGALLYGTPPGDTLDQPWTLPMKDLPAWTAFVTDRVKKTKGRECYWELWNEPPNGIGPDQTAKDYAKLLVDTYDTITALEPHAVVAMCAKSVHVNWLEQVIHAGGKDHFDCIILHPYEVMDTAVEHPGAEPIYLNIVPTVRKMLAAQDPAKVNVPIIFTELGYEADRGANRQAAALVKSFTMGAAEGVQCIDWTEGMDGDSGPLGLLTADLKPRPSYTAMAQMIKNLSPHPNYVGWVQFHDKDYGFVFQNGTENVVVTWAPAGTQDAIDFGVPVSVIDPLTGAISQESKVALTDSPIIATGISADIVKQAGANKTKPIPWIGDYTHASSVSVAFGPSNAEKGLHTQSATSIAADVVAYGGSARAGGVPGGNVFMVDPNFLCYTPTPLEIKIVVRRDASNDKAGFNLIYESTNGFKKLAWYSVPDNKGWHTVTYKITDDEFVSMWGYNFSLDSGGNILNKYAIQSVTVTKLNP